MKKFFLIAGLIAVAAVIINYSLGGFKSVEAGLVSVNTTVVYGKIYEGSYSSETLDETLAEFRKLLSESGEKGQLTIINYNQPELEKRGTVKQFIGIVWDHQPTSSNYDSLLIEPYNGAQFVVPVKPLVMPSPEKLTDLAQEFAEQMETSLAGYSIEQYQDRNLIINFPFKTD